MYKTRVTEMREVEAMSGEEGKRRIPPVSGAQAERAASKVVSQPLTKYPLPPSDPWV